MNATLAHAVASLPNWFRRLALRNPVMWGLRNRLSHAVAVQMDAPLADVSLWLPSWYADTYGGRFVEPEVVRFLLNHVRPASTVIDVGGFAGIYSILLSRLVGPTGRVIAVEPVVENFELLQKNVTHANCTNVRVIHAAASDRNEPVAFRRMRGRYMPYGTLAGDVDDPTRYESVSVNGRTLDSVLADEGVSDVALLKIDVEGGEALVLRGLANTIARHRPTLVIEIHDSPPHDQARAREALPIVFDGGYDVFDLENDQALSRPLGSPSDWSGQHHCVALAKGDARQR